MNLMSYQSKREKLANIINSKLLSTVRKGDLNYYKVVTLLMNETYASENIVKDALDVAIKSGKMKEIRLLTINDEEVEDWLTKLRKHEVETKKEKSKIEEVFKEMGVDEDDIHR